MSSASALASLASNLSTETVEALLKNMNSTQIISTLETLQSAGVNISSIDVPTVISSLNTTQITGLLQSNSTVVNGLLQSLQPTQVVTLIYGFQNMTSQLFQAYATTNTTAYYTEGVTLVSLLMDKLNNVFTDTQLLGLFSILSSGAALGTGAKQFLKKAHTLIAGFFGGASLPASVSVPERLVDLVIDYQPALFGDYPTHTDIGPSALFVAIFAIFTFVYLGLFFKNWSLGHKFPVTLGLALYSLIRCLGFILRIVWAKNVTRLDVGLTSTIFIAICTVFLPSMNLILAQRYFTWKHPLHGSSKVFMGLLYIIYALVFGVITMTIIAACVQVDYFLSAHHFKMTKQVIQAASVLVLLYSLLSMALVLGAAIIPSCSQDKEVLTYQPSWIKSFKWNYFVTKGAASQEEATVPESQRHAVRIIQSSSYHYETVNRDVEHESKLSHFGSIAIIFSTTVLLFIGEIFRCVSTFIEQYHKNESWIFKPVVMYVMFGALETIVNLLYIFGRIDLRFYKPDAFKKSTASGVSPVASSEDAVSEVKSAEQDEEKAVETEAKN